jgi:Tfp pilus assembly protein PilV
MERGAVLLEAILAVALVAISLLAVSQVGVQINTLRQVSAHQSIAESAIYRQLELLRASDFSTLPARDGNPFDDNVDVDGDSRADETAIRVTEDVPNLLRVELGIQWGEGRRARRTVWLTDRRSLGGAP